MRKDKTTVEMTGEKGMGAKKRRVALVLGGGGARGIAHIGAIGELERRGFEIAAVAGTSMGALVGLSLIHILNLRAGCSGMTIQRMM